MGRFALGRDDGFKSKGLLSSSVKEFCGADSSATYPTHAILMIVEGATHDSRPGRCIAWRPSAGQQRPIAGTYKYIFRRQALVVGIS